MVALTSSTLPVMDSPWVTMVGNFPALLRPGPRIRGICLIRVSDARKASYFLAENTEKDKVHIPALGKVLFRVSNLSLCLAWNW